MSRYADREVIITAEQIETFHELHAAALKTRDGDSNDAEFEALWDLTEFLSEFVAGLRGDRAADA